MFYLHASNRTENLLHHLGAVIRADVKRALFAKELFLIQSQGMERMVCQTMADEFKSFCNFQFMFPLHFLGFIAEKIGIRNNSDSYDRQILTWRIEAHLRDLSHENLSELQSYLTGDNRKLKRFQLARKLAHIFDLYQVMRPEMLVEWAGNRSVTDLPVEKWQKQLWLELTADAQGGNHRGILLRQVIEKLGSGEKFNHLLPNRISVFGLHIMPPVFLEFLSSLSKLSDVHLFILSPCKHYWGDLETKRITLKRILNLSPQQRNTAEQQEDERHPLLGTMGQQGRDFQKMMLENVDFEVEFESFEDPLEEPVSRTLLRTLQSDLLHGEVVQEKDSSFVGCDGSIRVVSCHSAFREITVLRDHLLQLLHEDHTLELRDIIVMAPNIQEYASLVPAVFGDIQHSIADYSLQRKNRYINAFISFLDLFKGRFGWSEIMDLLRQPIVHTNFALTTADLDTLQHWILDSGIRWGLSTEQREHMGVHFAEASWSAGLDRLLMGYAIDSEEFIDGVLPFSDVEGGKAEILGGLCQFVDIIERNRIRFLSESSLDDWSTALLTVMVELFGENDNRDYAELHSILSEPAVRYGTFHSENVDYDVILEWLKSFVRESRSSSGFLRGQLTFCSMLPMRSVPFRVVCLLGLNDGHFPRTDNKSTFDLMGQEFRPGDRSARDDDRYQFLEAVLAARSNLYLSYIGQSIHSNEAIPPSVLVTEFLDILSTLYGVRDAVAEHPLHPFNKNYFIKRKENRLFSYNQYYCRTAENLQEGTLSPEPWWQGELAGDIEQIDFNNLLSYYRNPQAWFVRNCLGVHLEKDQDLPDERELFDLGGLEKYMVEQEVVGKLLTGQESDIFSELKSKGRWPLGMPGTISYRNKLDELAVFVDSARSQDMGERIPDTSFEIKIGRYTLTGTLSNLYECGVMLVRYADAKGKDLLTGWLHHLVANHLFGGTKSTIVTASDVYNFSSGDTNPELELLLEHFVTGCNRPSSFFIEPALGYCRQVNSRSGIPPLQKSRDILRDTLEKGYEPAWNLLLQGQDEESVLGAEFETLCLEIMSPIWSAANEN